MAARLNLAHTDAVREKIKTSQLVNRLQAFAFHEADPKTGEPVVIDAGRMKAIEILLRKSLPDLQAVDINANVSGGLTINISPPDAAL